MSLDFDGVDDVVNSNAGVTLGNTITFATWFDADDQGEGSVGSILWHGGAFPPRNAWNWGGAGVLSFFADWSVTDGTWTMSSAFAAVTGWKFVAMTYDFGATTNNPTMYTLVESTFSTLTVGSGLTESSSPAGSAGGDGVVLYLGNINDGSRTWNGRIGEFAMWKRVLSAEEVRGVALLGVNSAPDHFIYLPMDPTNQNLGSGGTAFTITGAVSGENPPTRPAGRKG